MDSENAPTQGPGAKPPPNPSTAKTLKFSEHAVAPPAEAVEAGRNSNNRYGRYVRVELLGAGGMGEVWQAWDTQLNRWIALKILKQTEEAERARFIQEAQMAARLNHPNIAAVYEVGIAQGRPFLAMQYIKGHTLVASIGQRKYVSLIRDVALALHAAHQQGIIHRDIKPANLIIDETSRVFILDFGLAKMTHVASKMSQSGIVLGTPVYMSPEQARGDREADGRTDIYSLGVTLYEMLTGSLPFEDKDVIRLLRTICSDDPVPPRKLNPKIPKDLATIAMKCLEKNPALRYATAHELADDLSRYLAGDPILGRPRSTLQKIGRVIVKRKGVVAVVAVLLASAAGFWGYGWKQRHEAGDWVRRADGLVDAAEAKLRTGGVPSSEFGEAQKLYDQAAVRVPVDSDRARRCKAWLAEQMAGAERRKRFDEIIAPRLERVKVLSQSVENWRRGVEILAEGLALMPEASEAWMRKAEFHESLHEFELALDSYDRALNVNPGLGAAHFRKGWILDRNFKRYDEAEVEYEKGRLLDPTDEFAIVGLSRVAYARGDFVKSMDLCNQVQKAGAHLPDVFIMLGCLRNDSRTPYYDLKRALEDFTRALEVNPNSSVAHYNRGIVRNSLGDLEGALADLDETIALDPTYPEPYVNRGNARYGKGDVAGARADYDKALELNPQHSHGHYNRGLLRWTQNDVRGALEDYDAAIRGQPDFPMALANRGLARAALNDVSGAIEDFRQALKIAPPKWPLREDVEKQLKALEPERQ